MKREGGGGRDEGFRDPGMGQDPGGAQEVCLPGGGPSNHASGGDGGKEVRVRQKKPLGTCKRGSLVNEIY